MRNQDTSFVSEALALYLEDFYSLASLSGNAGGTWLERHLAQQIQDSLGLHPGICAALDEGWMVPGDGLENIGPYGEHYDAPDLTWNEVQLLGGVA